MFTSQRVRLELFCLASLCSYLATGSSLHAQMTEQQLLNAHAASAANFETKYNDVMDEIWYLWTDYYSGIEDAANAEPPDWDAAADIWAPVTGYGYNNRIITLNTRAAQMCYYNNDMYYISVELIQRFNNTSTVGWQAQFARWQKIDMVQTYVGHTDPEYDISNDLVDQLEDIDDWNTEGNPGGGGNFTGATYTTTWAAGYLEQVRENTWASAFMFVW